MYRRSQKGETNFRQAEAGGRLGSVARPESRQTGIRMQRVMDFGLWVTINHEML